MKAADLTVGSKSTKDRLNDATIKLAATTIVEGVQKKFVKNDKSKKLKSKQKTFGKMIKKFMKVLHKKVHGVT